VPLFFLRIVKGKFSEGFGNFVKGTGKRNFGDVKEEGGE